MFYIRSNSSSKTIIEKEILLKEGIKRVEKSNQDISLMYKLPSGKGIKVILGTGKCEYYLSIEGYPTKNSKQIVSRSSSLSKIYSDIKDIKIDPKFSGMVYIREDGTNKEIAQIKGVSNVNKVIKDISIPITELENKVVELKEDKIVEKKEDNIIDLKDFEKKIHKDDVSHLELEKDIDVTSIENIKEESTGKFVSYNISGVLRLGSKVILSEQIYNYKEALAKYNLAKEDNDGQYREICLNGYRENGTHKVRFRKTFEQELLSYDYISEFVKDLGERLELLKTLEKDAKSAMAIEDKRYNAGYHIMEVCDMDMNNPEFIKNMLKMKISADKRRDMKKTVLLLSTINNLLSVPDTLSQNISDCIERLKIQTKEGIALYKNKDIDDFVKEYNVSKEAVETNNKINNKMTIRPLEIENKVVVYEKHYN